MINFNKELTMLKHCKATVISADGDVKKIPCVRIIGIAFAAMLSMYLFPGCMWTGPHGESFAIIPSLPVSVELVDTDPYYYQGGYYYYYHDNSWFYSHSRGGPWSNLPRDHYPRDVRFKNQGNGNRGQHQEQGQGERHY